MKSRSWASSVTPPGVGHPPNHLVHVGAGAPHRKGVGRQGGATATSKGRAQGSLRGKAQGCWSFLPPTWLGAEACKPTPHPAPADWVAPASSLWPWEK